VCRKHHINNVAARLHITKLLIERSDAAVVGSCHCPCHAILLKNIINNKGKRQGHSSYLPTALIDYAVHFRSCVAQIRNVHNLSMQRIAIQSSFSLKDLCENH
jgi:hypothetical protein